MNNTFSGPLMGAICWNREGHQFIATLSDVEKPSSFAGVSFDAHTGKFVAQFVSIENDIHYDLHEMIQLTWEVHQFVVNRFDVVNQRGRDVMAFLVEAWVANRTGQPAPRLLPQSD